MPEGAEGRAGLELGEARLEQEAEGLPGAAHPERAHEQQQQDAEEDRERQAGQSLDALADPEPDDRDRRHAEPERQEELQAGIADLGVEEVARREPRRIAARRPGGGPREVVERPARDDRVVAEQQEGAEHAPHAEDGPPRARGFPERADGALLRPPADQQLRHHDRHPDHQDADQVDEDERAPVVVPGDVGEAPEVAQADGAARGGEDEAGAGAPVAAVALHPIPPRLRAAVAKRLAVRNSADGPAQAV